MYRHVLQEDAWGMPPCPGYHVLSVSWLEYPYDGEEGKGGRAALANGNVALRAAS